MGRTTPPMLVAFALILSSFALAQAPALAPASPVPLVKIGRNVPGSVLPEADGFRLTAVTDVNKDVSVDAVLLPKTVCKRLFGGEIANNYAAVQMTISNRSANAALIIQSAFLDYHEWLFSGDFNPKASIDSDLRTWQTQNRNDQIASTEARLVRGDLLDAQLWTWRNGFIRAITAVGTIASGFQFVTSTQDYIRGISAFGNQVVPALGVLWPDSTQLQINRISDFGFQTNHIVPKQGADIVVAFFPIDRFLTPYFKKIFLKSPASFYVPGEMIVDPVQDKVLASLLQKAGLFAGKSQAELSSAIATTLGKHERLTVLSRLKKDPTDAEKLTSDEEVALSMLQRASLNNIHVVISGVMTIDANAVPAIIDSVALDQNAALQATWKADEKVRTGVLTGTFLSDGVASIQGQELLGISDPIVDKKRSTDKQLFFTFKLSKDIPSGTELPFIVTKQAKDGTATISTKSTFTVNYEETPAARAPANGKPATNTKGKPDRDVAPPASAK